MTPPPTLIMLVGRPGSGKSYLGRLVAARLTPAIYRRRVRELRLVQGMAPDLLIRWYAAAFDNTGQGLLVPDDPIRNLRAAEALYRQLHV